MQRHRLSPLSFGLIQAGVAGAFLTAWLLLPAERRADVQAALPLVTAPLPQVEIPRSVPLVVQPLYDDPEVVSDEELASVLRRIVPRFAQHNLRPNYIEHALRAWGAHAEFQDPAALSGPQMVDFLTDHGQYLLSWGKNAEPLLLDRPEGVAIRWESGQDASVHHDHWLASLTEAGVPLSHAVFTPTRRDMTMNDALQEAMRDFHLDELEVEWSAMAFGLWIAPEHRWVTGDGREITFDLLARRLMRGHCRFGVCSGTHRIYSLTLLLRLHQEYNILSQEVYDEVYAHLEQMRDLIIVSQFPDGSWPPNWSAGRAAVTHPSSDPMYRTVIATGHHLEWLAIAPESLHPPREQIRKAADWLIERVRSREQAEIASQYTFYSHVGNALALWRNTHPAPFWLKWEQAHPWQAGDDGERLPVAAPRL
ncbi:MAG: hypothetical protein KDA79_20240 [Planctomycetaceae bacterium]|nr:hypothetical protein [Planctomycetaceae bacterium]